MNALSSLAISLCLCLFTQPLWAENQQPPSLQHLIDQVIEAYGGEKVWRNTRSIQQSGKIHSLRRGITGQIERTYQYPDRMKVAIRYSANDTELRQLDGEHAWKNGRAASRPYMLATRLQASRLGLPQLLLENRAAARDHGLMQAEGGSRRHVIELPLQFGLRLLLEIEPLSHRILRSRGLMTMGGQMMEFSASYEDFRHIEGRLIPFKEHHYAMGGYIGYTTLEAVSFPDHSFH